MPEKQKRILIIRLSALGDVLRTLPAFQAIRKNYPKDYIAWAVEEPASPILEANPKIDEVIVFPKKSIKEKLKSKKDFFDGIKEYSGFLKTIKSRNFDLVIDFHGLLKSGIISFSTGAQDRIGFTRKFSKEFNFLFNNRRYSIKTDNISRITRNLALVEKMGLKVDKINPVINIPEKDREKIEGFFKQQQIDRRRPVIAIHPGTSSDTIYKRWEPYRWAVVADRAIADHAAQVIFTWAGAEIEMVKEIIGLMKYRSVIAPETENVCQLAQIFKYSDVFLGGDTGPMHLAAFVKTPVVAVFGPTNHIVNEPFPGTPHIIIRKELDCSPCRKKMCSKRDCMKGIKEGDVIRAVTIMIESVKQNSSEPS